MVVGQHPGTLVSIPQTANVVFVGMFIYKWLLVDINQPTNQKPFVDDWKAAMIPYSSVDCMTSRENVKRAWTVWGLAAANGQTIGFTVGHCVPGVATTVLLKLEPESTELMQNVGYYCRGKWMEAFIGYLNLKPNDLNDFLKQALIDFIRSLFYSLLYAGCTNTDLDDVVVHNYDFDTVERLVWEVVDFSTGSWAAPRVVPIDIPWFMAHDFEKAADGLLIRIIIYYIIYYWFWK